MQTETAPGELLSRVLAGERYSDDLLRRVLAEDDGRALFSVVVERLGDLFEPRLCEAYVRLFSRVAEMLLPDVNAADLIKRYERIRRIRPCEKRDIRDIFVLSRVTLGADVAVTSVVLDALRKRFPGAAIHLAGARKNWELFAASEIRHYPWDYPRSGSLADRLSRLPQFDGGSSIVVDPDSRLSQLGVLPVCPEEDYFFFESRAYGGDGSDALPVLASRWAKEVFGTEGQAFVAPEPVAMHCDVAVSFGAGENEEKRISDVFEEELLHSLAARGLSVTVDTGAGGREAERIERLASRIPQIRTFHGKYASFASMILQAKLYIGYDSAGQHVAAASGVPLLSIFAGFPSERMFQRWQPYGPGQAEVIQVRERDLPALMVRVTAAVNRLLFERGGQ